jgi:hypothetical protein
MGALDQFIADLLLSHGLNLLRLAAGVRIKVLALLSAMSVELAAKLNEQDITDFGRQRLNALLRESNAVIELYYGKAQVEIFDTLAALGKIEADYTASVLTQAFQARIAIGLPTETYLEKLVGDTLIQGAASANWWKRQGLDTQFRFSNAVRMGAAQGETNRQIVARVVGTPTAPGVMQVARRNAYALVQTSVQAVANAARLETFQQNSDVVEALVWLATLDSHTCLICAERDLAQYTLTDQQPIDGALPWDGGPGAIHFSALVQGTLIQTERGSVPIESVVVGDKVLTHTGNYKLVTAHRSKVCEGGVVRIINTESGRMLRAADDHPVIIAGNKWKFVGALEVGDYLLGNPEQFDEVTRIASLIDTQPEYGPALSDETQISVKRAIKLVASDIDLECDHGIWSSEVEHRASRLVLCNPSVIEDQGSLHHLLALADALKQLGSDGFSNFLALLIGNDPASTSRADFGGEARINFCLNDFLKDAGHFDGVIGAHSDRMRPHDCIRFLEEAASPMINTGMSGDLACVGIESELFKSGANENLIAAGVGGERSISKAVTPLNGTQGVFSDDVFGGDKLAKAGVLFGHDKIISLDMQTYNGNLYDLEVDEDCSYVAGGIVVSNCRCTVTTKTKSFADLGLDMPEPAPSERASGYGPMPGDLNFNDWLAGKDAAFRKEYLGAGRAELFESGKITLNDLLDLKGNPLSLAQLRAKYR